MSTGSVASRLVVGAADRARSLVPRQLIPLIPRSLRRRLQKARRAQFTSEPLFEPFSAHGVTREQVLPMLERKWFHRMPLGHGIVTPGSDNSSEKLSKVGLPESLAGLSVLDIGTFDGFFAFEAERRGAARVLAVDHPWWMEPNGHFANFDWVRRTFHSRVESASLDIQTPPPVGMGKFDLVLFLGVLYHLPLPQLALQSVYALTANQMILETEVALTHPREPLLYLKPAGYEESPNTCVPNLAAVSHMLEMAGFRRHELYGLQRTWHKRGRAVFHAWR